MFSCKIIKKRRNSQRFCPSFSRINSFIGAAHFPLLSKDRTRPFSVQKRMFFIRNRCVLFRNARFSSEIFIFCSETHVFHQKFLFFAQKRTFFIRNRCILLRNARFSSKISVFCSETHVSEQNFKTFVKDVRAKIRNCIFLLRMHERKSEIVLFC